MTTQDEMDRRAFEGMLEDAWQDGTIATFDTNIVAAGISTSSHGHIIQCYGFSEDEAIGLRDYVFAAIKHQREASAGEVVVTTNESGEAVAVTRQDDEGQVLSVIWQREFTSLDKLLVTPTVASAKAVEAALREAVTIVRHRKEIYSNAGEAHPENSIDRDRCFARANAALDIERDILTLIPKPEKGWI